MADAENKRNQPFDTETAVSLEDLRVPKNRGKLRALDLTRKSSSFLRLGFLAWSSSFSSQRCSNKCPPKSSQRGLSISVQESRYFSHSLLDIHSCNSFIMSRVFPAVKRTSAIGLPGGRSGSVPSEIEEVNLSMEQMGMHVSPLFEEEASLKIMNILEEIEDRNRKLLLKEDLGALNEIDICSSKSVLKYLYNTLTLQHKDTLMKVTRMRKPEFKVASANSISILNYPGFSFEKQNLREVFIEGVDLSGADFRRTELLGSKMKRVDLRGARLDSSNLCNCDLRDTKFSGIDRVFQHISEVFSVVFSLDGRFLASASSDNSVKVWDAWTFSSLGTLNSHSSWVFSVVFCLDGRFLASASSDNSVKAWDVPTFSLLRTLKDHFSAVNSVVFSQTEDSSPFQAKIVHR